jgi:arginase
MRDIKLIEINSELGAGTRGASLGLAAMKIASLNAGSKFFAQYPSIQVETENETLYTNPQNPYAKYIETLRIVLNRLTDKISKTMSQNEFPVVLAGDHSTAAGTIAGIKKNHPNKRLGVVWIDAHADLNSPFTTPSGNMHGMPLAISLAEDNLSHQINQPQLETQAHWEALKNLSGISPAIHFEDLVLIGVRDMEQEEQDLIAKKHIKQHTVTQIRIEGIHKIVSQINDYLNDCDLIYISFDVDSMDPSYISYGTGTPVPVGFSEKEATEIILSLLENPKVCCFELTEVNPILDDKGNRMAETAFRILEKVTKAIN